MESTGYYTILGWTVTLVGGGIAYYYYKQPGGRQPRAFQGRAVRNALPRAAAALAPNDGDNARRRRREERAKTAPVIVRGGDTEARPQGNGTPRAPSADVEEKEDLAWARELQQKKQGTKLAAPARASAKQKTVKQSNANNRAAELSADSSTGDADDDLSPAVSPSLNGLSNDVTPNGKDVSDMLEPATSGPAVLRLTEPTNPKFNKPKQQPRPAPEQESKKQRQNRKKVEEKKAQREADEQERRHLQEQQRRTAREARGEPARNGLGTAATPANNAWKAPKHAAATSTPAANGQLLDTFTNDTTSTESTAPTSVSSSPVQQSKEKWWDSAIPSEEEQQRMLLEQDENSWSTVPAKSKKRNKNLDGAVLPVELAQ
jgi:hypothetical protein